MAKRIQVGGRIESKEVGGIVTGAAEILDDAKGKKQSVINDETDDELVRLDQSKQDNLTFDNAPTEGSDNPVKSGGLYTAQQAILLAIAAINELIPSAASALNQLADKAFVNSSISTNTATFRGTSAAGLNEQQFLAWANGLEHDLNDYVFWQTSDAAGNTLFKRYKWNGTEWAYEYTLNNSTFTAEQWEAIQSGITALLVAKLRALPTAQELIQSFDSKQNVLTFDDVPTLGSTNPVKSSGIYNAIDGEKERAETAEQGLSDLIDTIQALIPAEATVQNQLADKADVAAKIVAAIPSWKGQYDALTDLQAVTGAKAGDMGCVKTTDSDGHAVLTLYQYSAQGEWVEYYVLRHYAQNKPATTGTTGDYPYNGMGRIELQKNIVNGVNTLTQAMLTQQNTIYVIQYDFTLGEDITVPANSVLEFDGGSISGDGTDKDAITGANTHIEAKDVAIFKNGVVIAGSWNCPRIVSDWFGDITANNRIKQLTNLCSDNIQNEVVINGGTYIIQLTSNYEAGITPKSNTNIVLNGVLQLIDTEIAYYEIVNISSKSNVSICGNGSIVGNKSTTSLQSGEHGHCISINNSCTNIIIDGISISEAFGDGIVVEGTEDTPTDIKIHNCDIHHCRRNGISLINYERITIDSCYIHDISGTDPQAAIDIEPNQGNNYKAENCVIINCKIINLYCIGLSGHFEDTPIKNTLISNCYINNTYGAGYAVGVTDYVDNCVVSGCIIVGSFSGDESSKTKGCYIRNCNINLTFLMTATAFRFIENRILYTKDKLRSGYYFNNIIECIVDSSYICTLTGGVFELDGNIIKINKGSGTLFRLFQLVNDGILLKIGKNTIVYDDEYVAGGQECWMLAIGSAVSSDANKYLQAFFESNWDINVNTVYIDGGLVRKAVPSLRGALPCTTSDARPSLPKKGFRVFDTTLGKPIWWNGSAWVDATGQTV